MKIQWVTKQVRRTKKTDADVVIVRGIYGRKSDNVQIPGVMVKFSKKITDLVIKDADYIKAGYSEESGFERIYFDFCMDNSGFTLERYASGAAWTKFRTDTATFFESFFGSFELKLDPFSGYYYIEKDV